MWGGEPPGFFVSLAGEIAIEKLPIISLSKTSGQARVYLDGRHYYPGEFGSEVSRIRYGELLARLTAGLLVDPVDPSANDKTSVAELLIGVWHHANI
jgi:hypothetical protein